MPCNLEILLRLLDMRSKRSRLHVKGLCPIPLFPGLYSCAQTRPNSESTTHVSQYNVLSQQQYTSMAPKAVEVSQISSDLSEMVPTTNTDGAPPSTERTNFPLPRELRDRIYEYLLCHEHIKAAPYSTRSLQEQGPMSNPYRSSDCQLLTSIRSPERTNVRRARRTHTASKQPCSPLTIKCTTKLAKS